MRNDLKKYYSEEFKESVKKMKRSCTIRFLCCAFLVFAYFINPTAIQLILAILGGVFGLIFAAIVAGLVINPVVVMNMAKVNNKKTSSKKNIAKKNKWGLVYG